MARWSQHPQQAFLILCLSVDMYLEGGALLEQTQSGKQDGHHKYMQNPVSLELLRKDWKCFLGGRINWKPLFPVRYFSEHFILWRGKEALLSCTAKVLQHWETQSSVPDKRLF